MADDLLRSLNVDEWGRVVIGYDAALEILLADQNLSLIYVEESPELRQFNDMCRQFDKADEQIPPAPQETLSPENYHAARARKWLHDVDDSTLWDELYAKCNTEKEQTRFMLELKQFSEKGMLPVLLQLHHIIQKLDSEGVIRGVGRGSSVSSFILYLMEVHYINPMLYDLDVAEFLK